MNHTYESTEAAGRPRRPIETHLTIVASLHIALGVVALFTLAFAFFVVIGTGLAMGEFGEALLGTAIAALALLFLGVLSLPGIIGGIGLLMRKGWARIVLLVVSFIQLINIPVGTALGVYTLWVLLQEDSRRALGAAPATHAL